MTTTPAFFTLPDRPERLSYVGSKHYDWVTECLGAMGLTVEEAAETFAQVDRTIRIEGDALSVLRQVALSVTRDGLSSQGQQARLTFRCTEESVALGDTEELRAFHRRPGLSAYGRVQPASGRVESLEKARERWQDERVWHPLDELSRLVSQAQACLRRTEGVPLRQRNAMLLSFADIHGAISAAAVHMSAAPDLPDGYSYASNEEE